MSETNPENDPSLLNEPTQAQGPSADLPRLGSSSSAGDSLLGDPTLVGSPQGRLGREQLPDGDRYEEIKVLGQGGMGRVVLARDRKLGREVAIKRILVEDSAARARFQREARTVAGLNHRNVVQVYDVGEDGTGLYLVMEFIKGRTLAQRVRDEGPLSFESAVAVGMAITRALTVAHRKGIVHRDLKPGNVMLDEDDQVRVLDFGLAKAGVDSLSSQDGSLSLSGMAMGTPDYMAPEQWRNAKDVDHRADIYGLGATLYFMLSGRSPRVLDSEGIVGDAWRFIRRCVEDDPSARFFSADEAMEALSQCRDAITASSSSGETSTTDDEQGVVEGRCLSCGRQNPPDAKFCRSCGAGLQQNCPVCDNGQYVGFPICGSCGVVIADVIESERLRDEARQHLHECHYGRAQTAAEKALALWSACPEAEDLRATAQAQDAQAKSLLDTIKDLWQQEAYEEAQNHIAEYRKLRPDDTQIDDLSDQAPQLMRNRDYRRGLQELTAMTSPPQCIDAAKALFAQDLGDPVAIYEVVQTALSNWLKGDQRDLGSKAEEVDPAALAAALDGLYEAVPSLPTDFDGLRTQIGQLVKQQQYTQLLDQLRAEREPEKQIALADQILEQTLGNSKPVEAIRTEAQSRIRESQSELKKLQRLIDDKCWIEADALAQSIDTIRPNWKPVREARKRLAKRSSEASRLFSEVEDALAYDNKEPAITALRNYVRFCPGDSAKRQQLARLEDQQQDEQDEKYRQLIARILAIQNPERRLARIRKIVLKGGEFPKEVLAILRCDALFNKAKLSFAAGRYAEAVADFQAVLNDLPTLPDLTIIQDLMPEEGLDVAALSRSQVEQKHQQSNEAHARAQRRQRWTLAGVACIVIVTIFALLGVDYWCTDYALNRAHTLRSQNNPVAAQTALTSAGWLPWRAEAYAQTQEIIDQEILLQVLDETEVPTYAELMTLERHLAAYRAHELSNASRAYHWLLRLAEQVQARLHLDLQPLESELAVLYEPKVPTSVELRTLEQSLAAYRAHAGSNMMRADRWGYRLAEKIQARLRLDLQPLESELAVLDEPEVPTSAELRTLEQRLADYRVLAGSDPERAEQWKERLDAQLDARRVLDIAAAADSALQAGNRIVLQEWLREHADHSRAEELRAALAAIPDWAEKFGQDNYGRWADLKVAGVTQRLRYIAPGTFHMGSPKIEDLRSSNEDRYRVTLTRGYWLADSPCTQALWQAVMGSNPSRFKGNAQRPVEQVSWNETQKFLTRLNSLVNGLNARLPTEAEWEYAARAGSTGARYGDLDAIAWYSDNSDHTTHPVKHKQPNAWGLYDMIGNVSEWCGDWFGPYPTGAAINPTGPASGSNRANRGGSWGNGAASCRAANRLGNHPFIRYYFLGFRFLAQSTDK